MESDRVVSVQVVWGSGAVRDPLQSHDQTHTLLLPHCCSSDTVHNMPRKSNHEHLHMKDREFQNLVFETKARNQAGICYSPHLECSVSSAGLYNVQ